jgi:hypothetical protein
MRRTRTIWMLLAVIGCEGADGEQPILYPATCAGACDAMVACGDLGAAERVGCTLDCQSEPWARSYRQCRADTCGLSEALCESYGVRTCEAACSHMVACAELAAAEVDSCAADCRTEPWPGRFIDCKATTCGWSETACESFDGP